MDFKAVIFDFNGVLADDEPIHMEAFRWVADQEGLSVSETEYFERYLPFSDWDLFRNLFMDRGRALETGLLETLVERKVDRYYRILDERGKSDGKSVLFAGASEAIDAALELGPIAIASGARRKEIEFVLESGGLRDRFSVIVAAEDVELGKPAPEPFLEARDQLEAQIGKDRPGSYLAIEDSRGGIQSAKAAGMDCLAVAHSYRAALLDDADWVIPSIANFGAWLAGRGAR